MSETIEAVYRAKVTTGYL